jgi:hypothetical protein
MKFLSLLKYSAFWLSLLTVPAFASCPDLGSLLIKAYPAAIKTAQGFEIPGAPRQTVTTDMVACSPWSAKPEFTFLAVPRLEMTPKEENSGHGDIEIIVFDTKTSSLVARHIEKEAAFSDAIAFRSVEFDATRYDIKAGQYILGVKTGYWHNSSAFPYFQTVLWLYSFDGKKIAPVLEGLSIETSRGEYDQSRNCAGYSETRKFDITAGKSGVDGFRDLILNESITTETAKLQGDDCSSNTKTDPGKQYVLHFGDPHYGRFDGKGSFKDKSYEDIFSSILSER